MWPRAAAIALTVAVLAAAVMLAVRLFVGALNLLGSGSTERDPQFAEPAETFLRPAELSEEGEYVPRTEDPSAGWVIEEETPVDKTAEELSREAESAP